MSHDEAALSRMQQPSAQSGGALLQQMHAAPASISTRFEAEAEAHEEGEEDRVVKDDRTIGCPLRVERPVALSFEEFDQALRDLVSLGELHSASVATGGQSAIVRKWVSFEIPKRKVAGRR